MQWYYKSFKFIGTFQLTWPNGLRRRVSIRMGQKVGGSNPARDIYFNFECFALSPSRSAQLEGFYHWKCYNAFLHCISTSNEQALWICYCFFTCINSRLHYTPSLKRWLFPGACSHLWFSGVHQWYAIFCATMILFYFFRNTNQWGQILLKVDNALQKRARIQTLYYFVIYQQSYFSVDILQRNI